MVNHSKRQTLTVLTGGILASSLPSSSWGEFSNKHPQAIKNRVYNGTELLTQVEFTVSTFGVNSAVTTITNNSDVVVTVTVLKPGIVEHKSHYYDLNATIGSKGITLKPGQRRIIVAKPFIPLPKIA